MLKVEYIPIKDLGNILIKYSKVLSHESCISNILEVLINHIEDMIAKMLKL